MTRTQIEKYVGRRVLVQHDGQEKESTLAGVSNSGNYAEVGVGQLVHRDTVLKVLPEATPETPPATPPASEPPVE